MQIHFQQQIIISIRVFFSFIAINNSLAKHMEITFMVLLKCSVKLDTPIWEKTRILLDIHKFKSVWNLWDER